MSSTDGMSAKHHVGVLLDTAALSYSSAEDVSCCEAATPWYFNRYWELKSRKRKQRRKGRHR